MSRDFFYNGNRIDYTRAPSLSSADVTRIARQAVGQARSARSANPDEVSGAEILTDLLPGVSQSDFAEDHPLIFNVADQVRYSPSALGMAAVPFSDEIVAAVDAATGPETYDETSQRWQEYRANQEALNPGSAALGYLAQGIAISPFTGVAPSAGNSGALATAMRAIPGLAREGAFLGGMAAADSTDARPIAALTRGIPERDGRELTGMDRARALASQFGDVIGEAGSALYDTGAGALRGAALNVAMGAPITAAGQALTNRLRTGDVVAMGRAMDDAIESTPIDESLFDDSIARGAREAAQGGVELPGIEMVPSAGAADVESAIVRDRPGMLRRAFNTVMDAASEGLDPDLERIRAAGLRDRAQIRGVNNTMGIRGMSRRMDRYGILREGEIASTPEIINRATQAREIAGSELGRIRQEMGDEFIDADALANRLDDLAAQHRAVGDADRQAVADQLSEQAQKIRDTYSIARVRDPETGRIVQEFPYGHIADPVTGESERLSFVDYGDLQDLIDAQRGRNMSIYAGTPTRNIPLTRRGGLEAYRAINDTRDEMLGARSPELQRRARLARDVYHTASMISPANQVPTSMQTNPVLTRRLFAGSGGMIGAQVGGAIANAPGALVGGLAGGLVGVAGAQQMRNYENAIAAAWLAPNRGSLAAGRDVARQIASIVREGEAPQTVSAVRALLSAGSDDAARSALAQVAATAQREGATDAASAALGALDADAIRSRMPEIVRSVADRISADPSFGGAWQPVLEAAARRGTLAAVLASLSRRDPELAASLVSQVVELPSRQMAQPGQPATQTDAPTEAIPAGSYQGDPWLEDAAGAAPDTYDGDPWLEDENP